VSGDELEDLQLRAEETGLEAKLTAVDASLRELESAADEAGAGLAAWFAAMFSSDFRGLKDATGAIRAQIADIRDNWYRAKRNADMPEDGTVTEDDLKAQVKRKFREAVDAAKKSFAELSKDNRIGKFLKEGASLVKWQQFRTACVKLAALIGISLVGGFIGGPIPRGVAGPIVGH